MKKVSSVEGRSHSAVRRERGRERPMSGGRAREGEERTKQPNNQLMPSKSFDGLYTITNGSIDQKGVHSESERRKMK